MMRAYHSSATHCTSKTCQLCCDPSCCRHVMALIFVFCCLLLWASPSQGQDIKNAQNAADFKQRSDVHVDPSTLSMQLQIPLGSYPGRGGADVPITLYYSPKLWRMDYVANYINEGFSTYRPVYSESSASGWTSSLDFFKWPSAHGTYGYGVDMSLEKYDGFGNPVSTVTYSKTVARIHVTLPDGSRHELRRNDTVLAAGSDTTTGTFYAVDGTRLRYESSSRTLFFPDGSRFIYSYNASGQSNYLYYIDRNGNQNVYSYATGQWTDSLGRAFNLPPLNNSTVGDYSYQVPGVGGTTLSYTFRWRTLSTALTDMSQPLRYVGDRTWNYPYGSNGQPALFTSPVDDQRVIANSTAFNPVVLYQIVLPNNQTYTFTYNVWGEINKIVYPTGAYESFSYGIVEPLSGHIDDQLYSQTNRGVVGRGVSPSGQGGDIQTWTYGTALDTSAIPYRLIRAITNPDGSYQQIWYHTGRGNAIKFGFEDARAGKTFDGRLYTANPASGGVMLRRTLTEWTYDGPQPFDNNSTATRNARPQKTIQILLDTGGNALAAATTYQYDADLNVISSSQYAYASVAAATAQTGASTSIPTGALVRTSEATYLVNDAAIASATRTAYRNRQLIALPTSTRTKNSAGTIVAQGSISYDEAAYPLISIGAVTGWSDPATTVRGNATTSGSWLDTSGTYLQRHAQYDQCGNPTKAWDARGQLTQTQYSSTYAYAYPTSTISPIPNAGDGFSSDTSLVTSATYDFSTGLMTSTTDANNKTTSYAYNDPLNRLKTVTRPTGGGSTTYTYNDIVGSLYVRTQTTQSATMTQDSYQFYDNMGRASRSFQYENSDTSKPWLTTDTQYDVMNRVWRMSNIYRSTGSASATNPSGIWTTNGYDKLGRVIAVTTIDNAVVTTSYSGNQVTVTDQAGKKRRSVTDALGRLTQVVEDPNALAYQTDYTYDALDNLRRVTQGTQNRYFMYDSLSRLIRAKNPEQNVNVNLTGTDSVTGNTQWAMSYSYDANSNLMTRTDARNLTATYIYDYINRNTQISYSDGTILHHLYDSATNGRGRSRGVFFYVASGANSQTVTNNYDAMGRPLDQLQYFFANGVWGTAYTVSRTYDWVGHVLTQTYPSGRTVSYSYDRMGRTASFTGNLGDSVSRTYMSALAFDDSGRMIREQFGTDTPLYNKRHYNVRGQLYDMRLSTLNNDSDFNRGTIINYYSLSNYCFGCSGADNNGNLQIQHHVVPGNDAITTSTTMQENYGYDALNRLNWTGEYTVAGTVTQTASQGNIYDRWGNRTIDVNSWGTGINKKQFTVDAATNRLGVPAGQGGVMTYDANGNLTNDTYSSFGTRTYDVENRMVTALGSGGAQNVYTYDGDGHRVRRQIGAQVTWQVYGMEGELVAEYGAGGATTSPQKEYGYRNGELLVTASSGANVQWMVTDQLGTPRIIADRTGSLSGIRRHDYLPFGEEMFAGSGNRTAAGGYVADSVRQKFTSKERDTETGLDYFGARFYSSSAGRFTSVDPLLPSVRHVLNPQRLNLYSYVNNNPLSVIDPDGRDGQGKDGSKTIDIFLAFKPTDREYTTTRRGRVYDKGPNYDKLTDLAKQKGYTVRVFNSEHSTSKAVTDSLGSSAVTVIVGHGSRVVSEGQQPPTRFVSDSVQFKDGVVGVNGVTPTRVVNGFVEETGPSQPFPQVNAQIVGLFNCNSTDVLAGAFPSQTVVSVDGGRANGETTVGSLEKMAASFVESYVTTSDVNRAATASQGRLNTAIPANQDGDRVHVRSPQSPQPR